MRGRSPSPPILAIFALEKSITLFMLHGARVDETPSARGSIAIESKKGSQDFYRAKESIFLRGTSAP